MSQTDTRHSINRNIVECKVYFAERSCGEFKVLIETSWNVKGDEITSSMDTLKY